MTLRRRRGRWREEIPSTVWRWLLLPAWAIYRSGTAIRNTLYDYGWAPVFRLNIPVISVGNISAGGTGKTPVVRFLADYLTQHGQRPVVLMRGYRGKNRDGNNTNDEALTFTDTPVICHPDRLASGHQAIAKGATCIIMDDGFQHRRLHRDLDLVLIDATRCFTGVLPLGYDREADAALHRAHAVILTRSELVSADTCQELVTRLAHYGKPLLRLIETEHWLTNRDLSNRQPSSVLANQAVVLASGLGNPLGFERNAHNHGWRIVERWRFPDHHPYSHTDALALVATAQRLQATLVVTAKDAVKLAPLFDSLTTSAGPLPALLILHQRVALHPDDIPTLATLLNKTLAAHPAPTQQPTT